MTARKVYMEDEVEDLVAEVLHHKKKKPLTKDVEKSSGNKTQQFCVASLLVRNASTTG